MATANFIRPSKKAKTENLSAVTLAYLWSRRDSKRIGDLKRLRVLLKSGCTATLINKKLVKHLKKKKTTPTRWSTKAGKFNTAQKCKIEFNLPEFPAGREIEWDAYVDESPSHECRYDMIIGRDLLMHLGIDLVFSKAEIHWDNASIPMKTLETLSEENIDSLEHEILFSQDPDTIGA